MSAVEAVGMATSLLRGRRSVRRFSAQPVPTQADLTSWIEAATWAPSGHNRQPWRFVVLLDAETKARFASAMGGRLKADRLADGDAADEVEADVARSHARLTAAPAVILVCLTLEEMDRYPDRRRAEAERLMAVQGVAMAGQNLMLAAHESGWGSCWMCAPLFAPMEVRESLNLPGHWDPQGAILLGMASANPPPRPRKPVPDVAIWMGS